MKADLPPGPLPEGKGSFLLEDLISAVQAGPKYRHVSADLIRRLGAKELAARRNLKEAVKATKNALHQVAGAYLDGKFPYADWLEELRTARNLVPIAENGDSRAETPAPADRIGESPPVGSALSHQVGQDFEPAYGEAFRETCRRLMARHASTRERLP